MPFLALAQTINTSGISTTLQSFLTLINSYVIPFLFALAIVLFLWGLVKFVRSAGDSKARDEGKGMMIWGIVALAVMVSVYGLIGWLTSFAGINNPSAPSLPKVPTS